MIKDGVAVLAFDTRNEVTERIEFEPTAYRGNILQSSSRNERIRFLEMFPY